MAMCKLAVAAYAPKIIARIFPTLDHPDDKYFFFAGMIR
jgi:hypothetical protein